MDNRYSKQINNSQGDNGGECSLPFYYVDSGNYDEVKLSFSRMSKGGGDIVSYSIRRLVKQVESVDSEVFECK